MIDVLKRLAELDSNNKTIVKEDSVTECGPMGVMGGMPHTPASLSISAANGPELSGMLKDLMSLAGLQKVEPEHLGVEPPATVMTAEPVKAVGPAASDGEVMRGVLDKLHPNMDSDEQETDEGYDNTPADPNSANAFDAEEYAHHENQPGSGKDLAGKKRTGMQPIATMEEQLMAEYQAFVTEAK